MKAIVKYLFIFLVTIFLMILLLTCIALIPRSWIQKNSEESAEYLLERNCNFYNLVGEEHRWGELRIGDFSKVDQVADIILLSIAYYLDSDHPLNSILWARFYNGQKDLEAPLDTMNESYARTVTENSPPNEQYLRYWHGSLILLRPLLIVFNLHQIKYVHAAVISALSILLLYTLLKKRLYVETVCFGMAMISVSIWIVPMSLEYTWMFLLMLAGTTISVELASTRKFKSLNLLFFLTGMLAAYFDFLTTETITLLIPLLLTIRIFVRLEKEGGNEQRSSYRCWEFAIKNAILWGIGYVGTWSAKWIISALILRINTIPYIMGNVKTHLGGYDDMPVLKELCECLMRNVALLFPWGYGLWVSIVVGFIVEPNHACA